MEIVYYSLRFNKKLNTIAYSFEATNTIFVQLPENKISCSTICNLGCFICISFKSFCLLIYGKYKNQYRRAQSIKALITNAGLDVQRRCCRLELMLCHQLTIKMSLQWLVTAVFILTAGSAWLLQVIIALAPHRDAQCKQATSIHQRRMSLHSNWRMRVVCGMQSGK